MRNAIRNCVCGTCPHFHQPAGPGKMGVCVAHPPAPIVVGMTPQGSVLDPKAQRVAPVVQPIYPQVSGSHGCHEHPAFSVATGMRHLGDEDTATTLAALADREVMDKKEDDAA